MVGRGMGVGARGRWGPGAVPRGASLESARQRGVVQNKGFKSGAGQTRRYRGGALHVSQEQLSVGDMNTQGMGAKGGGLKPGEAIF